MNRCPSWIEARMACEETRLMTGSEVAAMFANSEILKERIFGVCKSFIATNMQNESKIADAGTAALHGADYLPTI